MCKCKSEELALVCDLGCRLKQKQQITLHCPAFPLEPFLRFQTADGSTVVAEIPTSLMRGVLNVWTALGEAACPMGPRIANSSVSVHLSETQLQGFLGAYKPDPKEIIGRLEAHVKGNLVTNVSGKQT